MWWNYKTIDQCTLLRWTISFLRSFQFKFSKSQIWFLLFQISCKRCALFFWTKNAFFPKIVSCNQHEAGWSLKKYFPLFPRLCQTETSLHTNAVDVLKPCWPKPTSQTVLIYQIKQSNESDTDHMCKILKNKQAAIAESLLHRRTKMFALEFITSSGRLWSASESIVKAPTSFLLSMQNWQDTAQLKNDRSPRIEPGARRSASSSLNKSKQSSSHIQFIWLEIQPGHSVWAHSIL